MKKKFKSIYSFLLSYWYLALWAPIFMIIEVAADLAQPKLLSQIVDEGINVANTDIILSTGIKMMIIVVIGFLGGVLSAVFASSASQCFGTKLRGNAFKKVTELSLEQTDKFTTGSLVTRLTNDITAVQDVISMCLRMVVRVGMQFVGGIVMALSLNVSFGFVFLVSLPIQVIMLIIFIKKISPYFTVVQQNIDAVNGVVRENVVGARVVKAYTMEDYETKRFNTANNTLTENTYHVQKLMSTLLPFLMIIMNLSVIAILTIGGHKVDLGQMQVGEVMAAVTYVTQILMSVMMIGMMFQNITRAKACAARLNELFAVEPTVIGGTEEFPNDFNEITYDDVDFSYPSATKENILSSLSLVIPRGKTTAILGATGCGKSTLLKLLGRFYNIDGGNIRIGEKNIKDLDIESLRKHIAFVLQKSELFTGTVMDNIRWGNENATEQEVYAAAKIAQAHEFISGFNNGYNTVISEKGSSLSGGQKQRISIARAVLKKPDILIFDDATSALDLSTEAALRTALKSELQGTTVIMVAQRVASVIGADRIAVIDGGGIAAYGTHKELMKTSDIYRDIYNSQLREEEV